ncbi:MAG: hypothetical protein HXY43_10640 [Fischerella sp.]|jgi:hypothetical protein|uniref:hypothetical protein n=1 Tax=unclassified Fischerella TaxID=494603 RepID=UPI0004AE0724|nr:MULTISPECIES: hypothetical protein [unclassified Fischerella]NWF59727.1 hypothetical protein [Fischerella sp.]
MNKGNASECQPQDRLALFLFKNVKAIAHTKKGCQGGLGVRGNTILKKECDK